MCQSWCKGEEETVQLTRDVPTMSRGEEFVKHMVTTMTMTMTMTAMELKTQLKYSSHRTIVYWY